MYITFSIFILYTLHQVLSISLCYIYYYCSECSTVCRLQFLSCNIHEYSHSEHRFPLRSEHSLERKTLLKKINEFRIEYVGHNSLCGSDPQTGSMRVITIVTLSKLCLHKCKEHLLKILSAKIVCWRFSSHSNKTLIARNFYS